MWAGYGGVDVELPVNRKVLWDRGTDRIELNKPNRIEFCRSTATLLLITASGPKTLVEVLGGNLSPSRLTPINGTCITFSSLTSGRMQDHDVGGRTAVTKWTNKVQ